MMFVEYIAILPTKTVTDTCQYCYFMYPSFEIYITLILMPIEILCHDSVTKTGITPLPNCVQIQKIIKMRLTELKKLGNYKQYYKRE